MFIIQTYSTLRIVLNMVLKLLTLGLTQLDTVARIIQVMVYSQAPVTVIKEIVYFN